MSTHLYEIVKVCYAIYIMEKIDIIDVKQIRTNPFQPRQTFVKEKLEELAASIKENGLIQPIIVRKSPIVVMNYLLEKDATEQLKWLVSKKSQRL